MNKNSIEFLLYAYFQIKVNDDYDKICNAAIDKAYSDATMMAAFNALKKRAEKSVIEDAKKSGIRKIRESLNDLISATDYDKSHDKLCKDVVGEFKGIKTEKDDKAFTYGNAQKWVNMTMKNLYVISNAIKDINGKLPKECEEILNIADKFHVPVDRYIIEAVLEDEDFNNKKLPQKDETIKPWSTWVEEDYKCFLGEVKEMCRKKQKTMIEWECEAWLKQHK